MSFNLWKFFLEDDVDSFRQYLARATFAHGSSKIATASPSGPAFKIGSPSTLATSPRTPTKPRKITGNTPQSSVGRGGGPVITRADINARDSFGRTILHHAASSQSENAPEFVKALLEVPTIDLYIQDLENGWTALHRALYAGNIEIAQMLLTRDIINVTDFSSQSRSQIGGLVRIKDHEGNSPFEVFGMTIAPRDLSESSHESGNDSDNDETNSVDFRDDTQENDRNVRTARPRVDLRGDEAFAFGSNKNLSLGLGDEDDRQFPERIHLERPEHLLWRLFEDRKAQRQQSLNTEDISNSVASLHQTEGLPAVIMHKPIKIQDIVMAKLHTAILTDDPVSNLHICGFGPGGRLGTGDETTRFKYVCIQGGGLASRRVSSIALGQDHCVAICASGEVFTWGSNKHGQLGYVLPEVSSKETPTQLTPRQLYGLVKKETIIGAAASSIHSVIYTANGLYTFGKNEGQLGLMDADARSLKIQDIPRRVGVSLLQAPIKTVSAIDRATVILLENREVIVLTHYGFTRVLFPLDESNILLSQTLPTRYSREANAICKITSGGNTIGALSTFGQVFTVDVPKPTESVPSSVSTTNPTKARNALPTPSRVWTLKKSHMSAADVAIGQDGSIILCTEAGAVWKKEKRANIKSVHTKGTEANRPKDYKFVRVPHLTRAIAVRSNAFGAFTAVRKDCDVTRDQILVDAPMLLHDLFPLLSFHNYGHRSSREDEFAAEPQLRFWQAAEKEPSPSLIKAALMKNPATEEEFLHLSKRFETLTDTQYDVWVTSNVTEVRIPVHSVILKARSRVLRSCLAEFHQTYYFMIPEIMSIEYGQTGEVELKLHGADFLTLINFVFYMYTESLVDVWRHTTRALHLAPRYRQVRVELMKIALSLELRRLERAVRLMVDPTRCMMEDFEMAYMDLDFYSDADVLVELAGGIERPAHSVVLSARCPFFEGLFHGRAAGMWLASRKSVSEGPPEPTRVDLRHVEVDIFDMVLRYVYADTSDELFDHLVTKDLDEFIDTVIEVMSVANELMLERLVQICQSVIGNHVNPRNVCGLLNAVAESSRDEFKKTALEYLCLSLEGMLEQRLLMDLEQYLLEELDDVVKENQLDFMPIVRSDIVQNELVERHPELPEQLEKSRQRRIDSMRLQNRHIEEEFRPTSKPRIGSFDKFGTSPVSTRKSDLRPPEDSSPKLSPALTPNDVGDELPFNMDEDESLSVRKRSSNATLRSASQPENTIPAISIRDSENTPSATIGTPDSALPMSPRTQESQPLLSGSRVSGFEVPKAAWKQFSNQENRADLKQIMEQASVSRVSNLTEAMKAAESPRGSAHKMSQKERKKQQQQLQQQQQQELKVQAEKVQVEPTRASSKSAASPQSPWTKVASSSKTNLLSVLSEQSNSPPKTGAPQRPPMTLRQTEPTSSNPTREDVPKQKRSISSTNATQTGKPSAPQIQSIRHTPLSMRSSSFVDAHTSMADILAQQAGEKTAIKEAAAKRSLQEIQQEQEFQEWWDQESRRVQEEEARANAASSRSSKANRGKSNRRRGTGRGASSAAPKDRDQKAEGHQDQAQVSASAPAPTPLTSEGQASRVGSEKRGRGSGRGRGKGRPRPDHELRVAKQ